jgi:chloramphenicol O-acetyltransferase
MGDISTKILTIFYTLQSKWILVIAISNLKNTIYYDFVQLILCTIHKNNNALNKYTSKTKYKFCTQTNNLRFWSLAYANIAEYHSANKTAFVFQMVKCSGTHQLYRIRITANAVGFYIIFEILFVNK